MPENQQEVHKLRTLVIEKFRGINKNAIRGSNSEEVFGQTPTAIYNLTNKRRRGLMALGASEDTTVNRVVGNLIGYDMEGLSSWWDDTAKTFSLYKPETAPITQSNAAYVAKGTPTHIPQVGVYESISQYMIYDKDGSIIEPHTYSSNSEIGQTGSVTTTIFQLPWFGDLVNRVRKLSDGNYWAVGEAGRISYSSDLITWTTMTMTAPEDITDIAYDGTTYVASGYNAAIFYATGTPTVAGDWTKEVFTIGYGGGGSAPTHFQSIIFADGIFAMVGDDAQIWTSPDNGTWTQQNPNGFNEFTGVAYNATGDSFVVLSGSGTDAIANFRHSTVQLTGLPTAVSPQTPQSFFNAASDGAVMVAVGYRTSTTNPLVIRSEDSGFTWSLVSDPLSDREINWIPRDVAFSNNKWLMVGSANHVYESDDGLSWTRVSVPVDSLTNWQTITINDDGDFVAVAQDTNSATIPASLGLKRGLYSVLAINYVITKQGKFATGLASKEYTIAAENLGITFNTLAAASISSDANVRTDFYVKIALATLDADGVYVQEKELDESTWLYVTTLEPDEDYIFDEIPISKTTAIGVDGTIGICSFRSSFSALRNGRLWGLLSEIETDYLWVDPEVEMQDFIEPNAVGFTERGYLNVMGINNTKGLGLNASSSITALAPSPNGLLAFADNETFLIAGDVLTQMTAEVYPDIGGCDVDVIPAILGGVIFSIWKGELYAVRQGRFDNASTDVFEPDNHIVQVIPEVETRSILVREADGTVLRLDLDDEIFWTNNVVGSADLLLPADNPKYVDDSGDVLHVVTASVTTPYIDFTIDFGNQWRRDKLMEFKFRISDYTYNAGNKPRLYYKSREQDPDIGAVDAKFVEASKHYDYYVAAMPLRVTATEYKLRLELREFGIDSKLHPYIELIHTRADDVPYTI